MGEHPDLPARKAKLSSNATASPLLTHQSASHMNNGGATITGINREMAWRIHNC